MKNKGADQKAGLHLSCLQIPEAGFLASRLIWISRFTFYGMLGGIFHFYSNFDRTVCQQKVEALSRRRASRSALFAYAPQ